jgi:3-oxoacyl-[acyl-carrier-protein] synthase-3
MNAGVGVMIRGTGSSLPAQVRTNEDFSRMVETSDEWIRTRTGIRERRVAAPGQTVATLGIEAAREALAAADLSPADIDLVICATVTASTMVPSAACLIQAGLGCRPVGAFDLIAACSGFVYALTVGDQFIRSGQCRNVLVVGSETLTRVVDFTDRNSCILFGDGAGAVVLSATDEPGRGVRYSRLYADGSRPELIRLPLAWPHGSEEALAAAGGAAYLKLNGREVYRFAVQQMMALIREALRDCALSVDDIKLLIPHQVNLRIIDSVISELNFPADKVMINLDRYGNTSAASVPIALDEAMRSGRAAAGDTVLFVAFGGGLTWSSAVVKL